MIKIALVGCGRIVQRHAELLSKRQIKDASLIAVCDIVEEKAEQVGMEFGVTHYTDMHQMMQVEEPDVVTVLTESGNHARNVIELAQYGKPIVVETNGTEPGDDADRMIKVCDQKIKSNYSSSNRIVSMYQLSS